MDYIPLSVPYGIERANELVSSCLRDNWVSSAGPQVTAFEQGLRSFTNATHSVCVGTGTAALHLALIAAGVKPGDLVLVPCLSFIATVNPVRYVGADPVFIDVDPSHWTMDIDLLEQFLRSDCQIADGKTIHKASGRPITAAIPVDVFGIPANISALARIAKEYAFAVVEDATEALGSYQSERHHVGTKADIAALSFNGNKIITTGAGGAVICNHQSYESIIRHLSTQAKRDTLRFEHDQVGYNYRMSNINAALGCSQLELLPVILERKAQIAEVYRKQLEDLGQDGSIEFQKIPDGATPNNWLTTILILKQSRAQEPVWLTVHQALMQARIETRPIWAPLHRQDPYQHALCVGGTIAETLCDKGLSLPSSAGLSDTDLERVITTLKNAVAEL